MKYEYSKILVTIIVLTIIFSGFYSNFYSNNKDDKRVMNFTATTITISSTFVINESTIDPLTGQHGLYGFNAIVNVVNGGSLIVKNATLYFVQDSISPISLNIYSGGSLILINSTLTVSPNRYFPDVFFTINDNGGSLRFLNSKVEYPGWFNVSDSNSIYFKNTIFTSLPPSTLSILQSYDPSIDISNYSFGPTPYFLSDTIYMVNVSFPSLFQSESSGPGVPRYDSYAGTVSPPRFVGTVAEGQTTPIVNQFYVSNLYINPYTTFYNGTLIINYSTSNTYQNNSYVYVYAKNDLISQPISIPYSIKRMNLTVPVSFYMTNYVVNSTFLGNQNNIFVNITGPKGGSITINYVKLNLYTDSSILNNFYYHNFNLISSTIYGKDVYLSINSNNSNGNPDKNFIFLKNSVAYFINLTIPKNTFYLDPPYYIGDQSSTIYIYRYIDLNVSNYNGAPLPNINVTYYSNILPIYVNGNVYTTAQQVNSLNAFIVNQIPGVYNVTNVKGIASIPVLSDIVQNIFWPNALYVGNYNLTLTQGGRILKNISVSVDYFPNLNVSGNNAWRKIILVVPDIQVKDLIVPEFLVHGKTYSISAVLTVLGKNVTNVPVIFYLNGKQIGSTYVNILVNKNTTATINYFDNVSTPGNYTLSVDANPYRTIYESNYSNNFMEKVVKMYPDVDLYVSNLSFSYFMLYSNSFLNFSVINNGMDSANNVIVNLVLNEPNGTLYKTWSSNFLPYQSISYSFEFYPTYQGNYYANVSVIYYWNINKTTYYSASYPGEIDFYPISAWYNITGNVSYNSPMPLKITVEIGVKNIVPSRAPTIQVEFFDLTDNLVLGYSNSYYLNGNIYANLSTNFLIYGKSYTIQIILNSNMAVSELNYSNNIIILNISYPYINDDDYNTLGPYMNGTVVPIYTNLTVSNGNIRNLTVIYIFPTINLEKTYFYPNPGNKLSILYDLNTSTLNFNGLNQLNITYEVVATYPGIYPYFVILQQGLIVVKQKPNIMLSYTFIPSQYVQSLTNVPQNTYITLLLNIENTGGWTAYGNTTVYVYNNNNLLEIFNVSNLSPGVTFQKYVNITALNVGNNNITIVANYNSISQVVQGPRVVQLTYTTIPPAIKIIMYSTYYSFYSGDSTTLTFFVINVNATEQQGRNVYINNITLSVTVAGSTYIVPIGENNMGSVSVKITNPGIYQVYVSYQLFGKMYEVTEPSELIVNARPFSLPIWLIAIIVVVVALIAGFFGYSLLKYKKQSKHLMVCGNCGSLIPEDAEKCPVCGVVFEKENVKCGNCGSWIKKDAKYCPVCGTVYLDKDDPEYSKYVSLRNEYLLDIQKYKDEAERDLGHKFTDQEFYSWWANKPEFLTFEKWLEKKEEEKKPTVECPVCHTLNPKGAKFCKVCGSPLPQEEDKK